VPTLIFDFDSTLVRSEGLDRLFDRSLEGVPDRARRLREFEAITDLGMAGELPFHLSLERRLSLLEADRTLVMSVAEELARDLSPSVGRNAPFFQGGNRPIFIVSGGFVELIEPAARILGIPPERIGANRFRFDEAGRVTGMDPDTPLALGGKAAAVAGWDLKPEEVWVVGDGATDMELRDLGLASRFVAFTENRRREPVVSRSDHVVRSIEELMTLLDTEPQ
jgi:D-3-phosphoglycerate dehydrogenase / 2-oxoglutarate reductase